jgi:hypothetical protein
MPERLPVCGIPFAHLHLSAGGVTAKEEVGMLHKCANPVCQNAFRKLTQGKLFLVETGESGLAAPQAEWKGANHRRIEHYWLCDQCAPSLTLAYERGRGVVAVPLTLSLLKKPASPKPFPRPSLGEAVPGDPGYAKEA